MAQKEFDDDDPMELVGVALPGGDVDSMAKGIVEEFVRMGCEDSTLLDLFANPVYAATHAIYREKGEEYVTALIRKVRAQWGFPRVSEKHESCISPNNWGEAGSRHQP